MHLADSLYKTKFFVFHPKFDLPNADQVHLVKGQFGELFFGEHPSDFFIGNLCQDASKKYRFHDCMAYSKDIIGYIDLKYKTYRSCVVPLQCIKEKWLAIDGVDLYYRGTKKELIKHDGQPCIRLTTEELIQQDIDKLKMYPKYVKTPENSKVLQDHFDEIKNEHAYFFGDKSIKMIKEHGFDLPEFFMIVNYGKCKLPEVSIQDGCYIINGKYSYRNSIRNILKFIKVYYACNKTLPDVNQIMNIMDKVYNKDDDIQHIIKVYTDSLLGFMSQFRLHDDIFKYVGPKYDFLDVDTETMTLSEFIHFFKTAHVYVSYNNDNNVRILWNMHIMKIMEQHLTDKKYNGFLEEWLLRKV